MKVQDLRELLEGLEDDAEVFIASQPSWPLAARLRGVVDAADLPHDDPEASGLPSDDPRDRSDVVWLVSGESSDYAPGAVFEQV